MMMTVSASRWKYFNRHLYVDVLTHPIAAHYLVNLQENFGIVKFQVPVFVKPAHFAPVIHSLTDGDFPSG
jgi:hypothetical protein